MKKLGILAFIWLIAFAKANADKTGISEEESTEKSSSSSFTRSSSRSLLQQSSFEDQESKFQEQQSSSLEQSSLQEQDSSFQEEQSLSKEQKSSFHEEQSSFKEEKSSFHEEQSSIEEQQSSSKEQQSYFQKQQLSFQEQQSSFQEQQSLLKEQKSIVKEQKSLLEEKKSTVHQQQSLLEEQKPTEQKQQSLLEEKKSNVQQHQSLLEEQKSTEQEQQSLLKEKKSTDQEQQSLLEEKKSTVHQQKSLLEEQNSTEQEQQSLLEEQKSTEQEQQSLLEERKSTDREQQSLFQDQQLSRKEQQLSLHKQQSSTFEKHQSQYNKERSSLRKQESTVRVNQEQFKQEKQVKQKNQKNIREEDYSSVKQNENYLSSTRKSQQELEHKTQQAVQPESIWIGNTPDSHVYTKIIDINKKANNSEKRSKSVVNDQEEGSNTNFDRKTNTRQPGRPGSIWIGNTPDSNVYTKIIDVNKKATSSKNTSKSAINNQEEDRTTNVIKKTNTKQAGQPESVWVGNTPDSNVYTKIIDINQKATSSEKTSKSVFNEQEEGSNTNVVKKTNTKQDGQPESVWIGNTPDSNVYTKIIDVNKKSNNSENTSKSVVDKQEEDRTTNVFRKINDKQGGQPKSVWFDNTPDSNVYTKIIDINKKATSSENTSKSVFNEQEEGSNTNVVKKTNTKQAGQPESVWIGNTPDSNAYTKIIDIDKKATSSENTSKYVVNKQKEGFPDNTKKTGHPESVWIGNTSDSNVYTKIIEINKKAITSESTATETSNSKSSSAAEVTVKNSQAKYQNKPIRPYTPRLILRPKLPVKSGTNQPTQPVLVKQYRPRYNLPPKTRTKRPIQHKLHQPKYNQVPRPGTKQPTPPGYNPPNKQEYNKKYQPESVWIGKTPDPKEYKIYHANKKDSKHEERDDEYYRTSSEYDVSRTETEKVVRGIRMELNLNTVFLDYGKNSDCFCSCSTDKSPFFVSIPRNKVKSYLNEML